LWQETGYPQCKTAFNLVSKAIRNMAQSKVLEWWETKIGHCVVTSTVIGILQNTLRTGMSQRH
jgi:hypothetical protein